jgi:hypothetical protein
VIVPQRNPVYLAKQAATLDVSRAAGSCSASTPVRGSCGAPGVLVLDPSDTGDVEVVLVDRLLPGDPRR